MARPSSKPACSIIVVRSVPMLFDNDEGAFGAAPLAAGAIVLVGRRA